VKGKITILNALSKRVSNLWYCGVVEEYIKKAKLSNGRKNLYGQAYRDWCNWKGFDYKPKQYRKEEKLPYIPSENEIDQLIGGMGQKLAYFLQIMKEGAFRPSETLRLKPENINLPTKACTLNDPSKNSRPRQFKMSDKLVSMLIPLTY
jgi:integrase